MAWQLWMYNKQPFRKRATLSCSVSWLVSEMVLFYYFLGKLSNLFSRTCRQGCYFVLYFLIFLLFWPWKLVALNITGLWHHRQLSRPTRAKPHLPDIRFMPIRTASICVYACLYIDIYIKREKYLWIYFLFPILWREILKDKQLSFFGTLPCFSEGKCLFSWK